MAFEVPDELLNKIRAVSMGMSKELEARYSMTVVKAFQDGWIEGYMARMHEEEDKSEAN